jgi:hypothetical protein
MSELGRPLEDTTIEAMLARRVPGHADRSLLAEIVATATSSRQERRTLRFLDRRRATWLALAAALLGLAVWLAVGGGSHRDTVIALKPSAPPSNFAILPDPSSSSSLGPTAPDSNLTCGANHSTVTFGAAMAPTPAAPMNVPAGTLDRGAYVTQPLNSIGFSPADVWFVRDGDATRIASIAGTDFSAVRIDDVSADGSLVLVDVRQEASNAESLPCNDQFLIRTDGTGITKVSATGITALAPDGRLSPDGQWAITSFDAPGHEAWLRRTDQLAGGTPSVRLCETGLRLNAVAWSADSRRLAVDCGGTIRIASVDRLPSVEAIDVPGGSGPVASLGWTGPTSLELVSSAESSGSHLYPVITPPRLRTLALPVDLSVAGAAWSAPRDVPQLSDSDQRSSLSPDGRTILVLLSPGNSTIAAWYTIDIASATASPVSRDVGFGPTTAGWSADGRSVLVVENGYLGTPALIVIDVATGDRRTVGSMPPDFTDGLFVGG